MGRILGRRGRAVAPLVRQAGRAFAVGRIAAGVALVAAPGPTTRRWLGTQTEDDAGRQVAVRGLGARDVVLGVGMLVAFRHGGEVRQAARWVEAAIVADLADAASTLVADDLDAERAAAAAGVAIGAALAGTAVRAGLR